MSLAMAFISLFSSTVFATVSMGWSITFRMPCFASAYSVMPSWFAFCLKRW